MGTTNTFDKLSVLGRGAQIQLCNPFHAERYVNDYPEGIDEVMELDSSTSYFKDFPKQAISKNNSPDLHFDYSINPYQGCEHGCVYCYARNSHTYWGYNAGIDFERKIIMKPDIAKRLELELNKPGYRPSPIMLSGNTDCYQPIERKMGLTRELLKTLLQYKHPVSLITKNVIIERDLDILEKLAELGLVHVSITINSLDETLRRKMEPRTATAKRRLEIIQKLHSRQIPVSLMLAPIVPGLNQHEIPNLINAAANAGASHVSYTLIRLNGALVEVFEDWLRKAYPDRADKILSGIAQCHQGRLNDSRWGNRMRGDGEYAEQIAQLIRVARRKYMGESSRQELRTDLFTPLGGKQLNLF